MNSANDSTRFAAGRNQLYQQTRSGSYVAGLQTDSATDAIRAFLNQVPAFEGGELRVWDHREQHLTAWVKWNPQKTESGSTVHVRENLYQDRMVALLGRLIEPQEKFRETMRQGIRLGV